MQAQRGNDELDPLEFDDFVREKMKLLDMDPELPRPQRQRRLLRRREEAQRDPADGAARADASRSSTKPTRGSTSTRCGSSRDGINQLAGKDNAIVLVTHYQRLLNYIVPDYVHVMEGGRIVKTGGKELALELEKRGYDWVEASQSARGGC